MTKPWFAFALVLLVAAVACSDDNSVAPFQTAPHAYITQVFVDFESAYRERNITKYNRIIDSNFRFYLTTQDVIDGRPSHWERAAEMEYTSNLLDPGYAGAFHCDSVRFQIHYPQPVIALHTFNPPGAPDETWYSTSLGYEFTFYFGPYVTITSAPGSRAEFTIRNAGTKAAPVWKIVELRDVDVIAADRQAAGTDVLVWTLGAVKAVYAPPPQ